MPNLEEPFIFGSCFSDGLEVNPSGSFGGRAVYEASAHLAAAAAAATSSVSVACVHIQYASNTCICRVHEAGVGPKRLAELPVATTTGAGVVAGCTTRGESGAATLTQESSKRVLDMFR